MMLGLCSLIMGLQIAIFLRIVGSFKLDLLGGHGWVHHFVFYFEKSDFLILFRSCSVLIFKFFKLQTLSAFLSCCSPASLHCIIHLIVGFGCMNVAAVGCIYQNGSEFNIDKS